MQTHESPSPFADREGILRILDANLNRAGEGLRVVEEFARFHGERSAPAARLKHLRHGLRDARARLEGSLPAGLTLERYRDAAGDVGRHQTTPDQARREDARAVAQASMKRLQESLRALEEYAKTIDAEAARRFAELRYQAYEIEPPLLADPARRARLAEASLYVLVTESLASTDALTACREAVAGGADIVQMREKDLEDGVFYERAVRMNGICRDGGALFLVNDRIHIAALADADGAHTGQGDLPAHLARRILGPERLLGRSTNAPERAKAAAAEGLDYIGVGPVYETNTKRHRAAVGLAYVRYAAENAEIPYFCIGSIRRETIDGVLEAGARAVAVCTAIIGARDIAAEAAWFKERLRRARATAVS